MDFFVALDHHPDPLRVSWVLRCQHQEEETSLEELGIHRLRLPKVAGMSVTCKGLHQSGASEVVLPLLRTHGANSGSPDAATQNLDIQTTPWIPGSSRQKCCVWLSTPGSAPASR